MKIEMEGWVLSLFETEYSDVVLTKNSIKVINLEGKVKRIIFNKPKKVDSKVLDKTSEKKGVQSGSSPIEGQNLPSISLPLKSDVKTVANLDDEIQKLKNSVQMCQDEFKVSSNQVQKLTDQLKVRDEPRIEHIEKKLDFLENNLQKLANEKDNQTREAQREKLGKVYHELQNNLKKLDSITDDPKWQKVRFRYKDKKGHDHYY